MSDFGVLDIRVHRLSEGRHSHDIFPGVLWLSMRIIGGISLIVKLTRKAISITSADDIRVGFESSDSPGRLQSPDDESDSTVRPTQNSFRERGREGQEKSHN